MTLEDFFRGRDESRRIFEALRAAVDAISPAELRVTKSQVAFRKFPAQPEGRGVAFAWAWMPDVYLGPGHAPLVLTVALRRRDSSPRWKQVVVPPGLPGRFTHHLELHSPEEIDDEVRAWLAEAWQGSG